MLDGWLIGVDVGGTFTDLYAFGPRGERRVHKCPSTPDDPSRAVVEGVDTLLGMIGVAGADVVRFAHGTTVGTNALLQRKGGRLVLVTTRGFRDLLEIGRQTRPHMYDLYADHPLPLVDRGNRLELDERVAANGEILVEPDSSVIDALVAQVRALDPQSCAVCLLFSFIEPVHERRLREALHAALPELPISLSSDVQPEFREYERCSTTVLNAYLQPVMASYIQSLEDGLTQRLAKARLGINQSSGGLMSPARARAFPIRTALSGPAAGAVAAGHLARQSKHARVITLDMGGTSADVALIQDGRPGIQYNGEVGGYPIRLPMVDVGTVGAGGGSIAWFERDGLMKVGPASAGAAPGPACYARGGTDATVTDANLLLGRLSPKGLLDGQMALDAALARTALEPHAERLGQRVEQVACGVVDIAVANMVRAIRRVSVERGHDPRECALMAFGGAGPLHARAVARSLDIATVIVPPSPGILCAQGLLVSDLTDEFVFSKLLTLSDTGLVELQTALDELVERASRWFEAEAIDASDQALELTLDARYSGQNFELSVPIWSGADLGVAGKRPALGSLGSLRAGFEAEHERVYGYANSADPVEAVNLRLRARGKMAAAGTAPLDAARKEIKPLSSREVWFSPEQSLATAVYARDDLHPGASIDGPCVVEQLDTTTVVFPSDRLTVDEFGNLEIEIGS